MALWQYDMGSYPVMSEGVLYAFCGLYEMNYIGIGPEQSILSDLVRPGAPLHAALVFW